MLCSDKLEKNSREFFAPSDEYSPVPFWFWNDELKKTEIKRQLNAFQEKGIRAFVIHPRIGLPEDMAYLSDSFMDYVIYAVEYAAQADMKVVLYDEGMYPSGSAHGGVVRENPSFASKGLILSSQPGDGVTSLTIAKTDGSYFVLAESGGTIRGIHYGEDDNQPGAPRSADLLNPAAVRSFIAQTHERYYHFLKQWFGTTVVAFFTDEPLILGRCCKTDMIPWTEDFLDDYISCGGSIRSLPALFTPDENDEKKIYRKALYDRLSHSYYRQLSSWCAQHGVALNGHPEKSEDIGYLKYFQIPCQDIVWRYVAPEDGTAITGPHSTMGKCSSDSARHRGKRRNGNECFGCCGAKNDPFCFTRDDMKWYLDWLFVRGVNMVYPHAFFYSLRGDRKQERPPDVGMHSTFWDQYAEITAYIKRMCWLLTDSVNQTEVAVLCGFSRLSWKIAQPLFEHQLEFNYLEEELLPECTIDDGALRIGKQRYTIIITDGIYDNPASHLVLEQFQLSGGSVIPFDPLTVCSEVTRRVVPDFTAESECRSLRKTHIVKNDVHYYLLVNEGELDIHTHLHLLKGCIVQVWNAETGAVTVLSPCSEYELFLPRRKSLILVIAV